MKKFALIAIGTLFLSMKMLGQSLPFEISNDKSGISRLPFEGGTVVSDLTDENLKFQFKIFTLKNGYVGFDLSGKSNERLLNVINDAGLNPSLNFSLDAGYRFYTDKDTTRFSWINFRAAGEYDEFKMYYPDSVFASQISKTIFRGQSLGASFNFLHLDSTTIWKRFFDIDLITITGVGVAFSSSNNMDNLSKVTITDEIQKDTSGNTIRTVTKSSTALIGDYETFNKFDIDFHYMTIPRVKRNKDKTNNYNVGFNYFIKLKIRTDQTTVDGGFGIFIIQDIEKLIRPYNKKDLTRNKHMRNKIGLVGGITFEYRDIPFQDIIKTQSENALISLRTGFNF